MEYPYSKPAVIPLAFYATGIERNPSGSLLKENFNAYRDQSNDVFTRNMFSINTKEYHDMLPKCKSMKAVTDRSHNDARANDYLHPRYHFYSNSGGVKDNNGIIGKTYYFKKNKIFAKDFYNTISASHKGEAVSKEKFNEMKRTESATNIRAKNQKRLKDNCLYFENKETANYKLNTERIHRDPRLSTTTTSKGVPHWMNRLSYRKASEIKDKVYSDLSHKTIPVFSRFHGWVNVEPGKERVKPLELQKKDPEKNQLTKPPWMTTSHWDKNYKDKGKNRFKDNLACLPYFNVKQNCKMTIWVDKENIQQKNKSVFSLGDFNHNVMLEKDVKESEKGISREPKQFFFD